MMGGEREETVVASATQDSFGAKGQLEVGGTTYEIYRLDAVEGLQDSIRSLPYSLKILLENLLRCEDGSNITAEHIRALAGWDPQAEPDTEIQFTPSRVVLQDFTGVPCVVDLATMREAVEELGGDASRINPLAPAELVIDHSVIADLFGAPDSFERNVELEYERNVERYQFLRWGQTAFDQFKVVPPGTGIVHQVNIEYLARVVFDRDRVAYPDTLVGTDSHTTMVNGLGVLGWGVGGIEAEAAMLGQPVSMLIPKVVGFRLTEHRGLGLDAADAPADHAQTVDHGGVRVGPDARVRVGDDTATVCFARVAGEHHPGEVLDVDLMHDAGPRGDDGEVVERALAPAQELVALAVALVLDLHVALERIGGAEDVGDHGVVDDHLGRRERVDPGGVAAEVGHRLAHRGEVNHARHAGEVLHDDARRGELDLLAGSGPGVPAGQRRDVVRGDILPVLGTQQVLQQDLQAVREGADVKAVTGDRIEPVDLVRRVTDLQARPGSEAVLAA